MKRHSVSVDSGPLKPGGSHCCEIARHELRCSAMPSPSLNAAPPVMPLSSRPGSSGQHPLSHSTSCTPWTGKNQGKRLQSQAKACCSQSHLPSRSFHGSFLTIGLVRAAIWGPTFPVCFRFAQTQTSQSYKGRQTGDASVGEPARFRCHRPTKVYRELELPSRT